MNSIGIKICYLLSIALLMYGCDLSNSPEPEDKPFEAQCIDGTLSSGALFRVCVPDGWRSGKDDLITFVPGYTNPATSTLTLPDWVIDDRGTTFSDAARMLGFAFATTSFRANGLVEPKWIDEDLEGVMDKFIDHFGSPRYSYLVGGSQGGLITTLGIEQHSTKPGGRFDGGLAACGPIGTYMMQFDHIAHFRVIFDYFFQDVLTDWDIWKQNLPDNIGWISNDIQINWEKDWDPLIREVFNDPDKNDRIQQLFGVTGAPVDLSAASTRLTTTLNILWYSVFGTNDALQKLRGISFNNLNYMYSGSGDDNLLNNGVERFIETGNARQNQYYLETSGVLAVPLVTIHTTGDEVVPYSHADYYRQKVDASGSSPLYTHFTVDRYGHCSFQPEEILAALTVLIDKVSSKQLVVPAKLLPEPWQQHEYNRLIMKYGEGSATAQKW